MGVAPIGGRVSGTTLARVAELAVRHASGRIRLTPHQKLLVLDVPPDQIDPLVSALNDLDLPAHPSEFRRGVMACTGIEFCKLALVETKARARTLVEELETRLPGFTVPFTIHINGCPNACVRTQVADDLPDYIERLARRFLDQRDGDESFAHWAHRAEEDDLR